MKVYKFNEFNNIDSVTLGFIDGKITESQFTNYIETNILNESLIGIKNYIKEKIINVLNSFLVKATTIGFSIITKFQSFFTWIIKKVSEWKDKHPVLYKVILITLMVVILLMVSASSAYAQTKGVPVPEAQINVAIGWLDLIKGKTDIDVLEINKAIAHLVDLRDGQIEITELNEKAIQIADSAVNTAEKMMKENDEDGSLSKMCTELMNRGSQFIEAFYSKSSDTEVVKLKMK